LLKDFIQAIASVILKNERFPPKRYYGEKAFNIFFLPFLTYTLNLYPTPTYPIGNSVKKRKLEKSCKNPGWVLSSVKLNIKEDVLLTKFAQSINSINVTFST
jgi:hypothetical protein